MPPRRNPPEGYFYLDTLVPIYRKNKEFVIELARSGHFKTARVWHYKVAPRQNDDGYVQHEGYDRALWVISCEEYLQIVQQFATKQPKFYVCAEVELGPYDKEEYAQTQQNHLEAQLKMWENVKSFSSSIEKEVE